MAFLNKYGVARHIYVPVVKRAVVDFAVGADWTPAAGDVKISKDGGAAANVTNLPTAITMGNTAMWDFSLTATEMQAAQVLVTVADSATKAVEDTMFILETYGNASGQHPFDLATATVTVGTAGISSTSFAAAAIDAAAIATDAITSAELAQSAADKILATACTEPTAIPAASPTALAALSFLLTLARNKITQTATTQLLRNDADAATIATFAVSDDGTTFIKAKGV